MIRLNSLNALLTLESDFTLYSPYNPTPIPIPVSENKEKESEDDVGHTEPACKLDQAQVKLQNDMKKWQREIEKVLH